jgi:hypothetical protein
MEILTSYIIHNFSIMFQFVGERSQNSLLHSIKLCWLKLSPTAECHLFFSDTVASMSGSMASVNSRLISF